MTEDPERERKIAMVKKILANALDQLEKQMYEAMDKYEKEQDAIQASWRREPNDNKTD